MNYASLLFLSLILATACSSNIKSRGPSSDSLPKISLQSSEGWAVQYSIQCSDQECSKFIVSEEGYKNSSWPQRISVPMGHEAIKQRIIDSHNVRINYSEELKQTSRQVMDPQNSKFESMVLPLVWIFAAAVTAYGETYERSPLGAKALKQVQDRLSEANDKLKDEKKNVVIQLNSDDMTRIRLILEPLLPLRK